MAQTKHSIYSTANECESNYENTEGFHNFSTSSEQNAISIASFNLIRQVATPYSTDTVNRFMQGCHVYRNIKHLGQSLWLIQSTDLNPMGYHVLSAMVEK